MAEEQGAFVSTSHKAGSEYGVRIFGEENFDHSQKVPWVIFEVCVVNYHQLGIHTEKARCE